MTSDFPRVTVCVPVRNGARTISRTLDSILAQDYPNFEIIVSDNCSDDETAKIVQEYSARGIRYYLNPHNLYYGENNWNHVLALATGPLIALYHADDIYMPATVRKQAEFLTAHPDVSAVFTMMQAIDEQDRPIRMGSMRLPEELRGQDRFGFPDYFNAVLKYCTFTPVPTMMTRRAVLDKAGNFRWQKYATAADVDLYLRMARQCGPIGVIDEPLHHYRVAERQVSSQLANGRTTLPDFHAVINAHLDDPEERQVVQPQSLALYELGRAYDHVLCATNLLAQGKTAEARGHLREALHCRYFATAFRRSRLPVRLLVGLFLLVSIRLGLGTFVGRRVQGLYAYQNACLRKPA